MRKDCRFVGLVSAATNARTAKLFFGTLAARELANAAVTCALAPCLAARTVGLPMDPPIASCGPTLLILLPALPKSHQQNVAPNLGLPGREVSGTPYGILLDGRNMPWAQLQSMKRC